LLRAGGSIFCRDFLLLFDLAKRRRKTWNSIGQPRLNLQNKK